MTRYNQLNYIYDFEQKKWIVLKPIHNVLGPGQIKILLLQKQIENEKERYSKYFPL